MRKIEAKITGFSIDKPGKEEVVVEESKKVNVIHMNESINRPEMLEGSTYKIKPATLEHAMYITINDVVLNPGTENEVRRPFEVFVNSKNMTEFQWIVALTRIISAVFRKGGDVEFLVEELKAVFDPKGGYWKSGGIYVPSVIAEFGLVLEEHLKKIGLIKSEELSAAQKELIASKRAELDKKESSDSDSSFPANATMCPKCHQKARVIMDGCSTCLNCADSKCG